MCVCMSVLCVRVCAFVPVIFLLDSCMFYVRMFYGPSWSDLNKYIHLLVYYLEEKLFASGKVYPIHVYYTVQWSEWKRYRMGPTVQLMFTACKVGGEMYVSFNKNRSLTRPSTPGADVFAQAWTLWMTPTAWNFKHLMTAFVFQLTQ